MSDGPPDDRQRAKCWTLVSLGRRYGVPDAETLAGTGLRAADLSDERVRLDLATEYVMVRNLLTRIDPAAPLAVEAGLDFRLETVGGWGEAIRHSRTLGEAIALSMDLGPGQHGLMEVSANVRGDVVVIEFGDGEVPPDLLLFVVVRALVAVAMTSVELFGRVTPPEQVTMRHPRPPWAGRLDDVFGVTVCWSAPVTGVTIKTSWLARPLPAVDPPDFAPAGLAAEVREHVAGLEPADAVTGKVAAALGLSVRTMSRRLRAEGTSFRQLLDERRHAEAVRLLAAGVSIEHVAQQLGYSEAGAFSRAFKRWSGRSPEAWRRARNAP